MAMHFSKEEQEALKNDTSEIYQKRTDETNREDIANLSVKGKWQQFKDYYLKNVIIAVVIVAILVVGIVQAATKKQTALYVAIQHDALDEETITAFQKAIEDYLEVNTGREVVTIDVASNDQKLQTYFYAGTADILITDEESFKTWGQSEYFYASDIDKQVAFYKDYDEKYLYSTEYITSKDIRDNKTSDVADTKASDTTKHNCGLYLTDSDKYRQIGGQLEKPVIGIATTTEHLTDAKKFTKYMMDNSKKMTLSKQ